MKMCEDCIKKSVCKYTEETEKFFKTLKEEDFKKLENISVSYNCKYKNNGKLF